METLTVECNNIGLYSGPEHITSFLEDFQDKNSHLFPSSDLSFSNPTELDVNPFVTRCGSKRKIDHLSLDTFSSWNEDLFYDDSESVVEMETESGSLDPLTKANSFEPSSNDSRCEHVDKKRKLDFEELALYQSESSSRSPPGFNIKEEPTEDLKPLNLSQSSEDTSSKVVSKQSTSLLELQSTIQSLDSDTMLSLKESFLRLAAQTRNGKSPSTSRTQSSYTYSSPLHMGQDMLTLQCLYGVISPSVPQVKSERMRTNASYYPVAPAPGISYPYVMNSHYLYPSVQPTTTVVIPETTVVASKCSDMHMYNSSGNNSIFSSAPCSKSMFYPSVQKKMNPTPFVTTNSVIAQNLYSQPVHVL